VEAVKGVKGRGWIEESLWVLGHLINIEEHAAESGLLDLSGEVREERRLYQEEWWRVLGVTEEFYRKNWCIFKHIASLIVHAEELAAWEEAAPALREASLEVLDSAKKLFWLLVSLGKQGETVKVEANA
jgi:hypothetical protein